MTVTGLGYITTGDLTAATTALVSTGDLTAATMSLVSTAILRRRWDLSTAGSVTTGDLTAAAIRQHHLNRGFARCVGIYHNWRCARYDWRFTFNCRMSSQQVIYQHHLILSTYVTDGDLPSTAGFHYRGRYSDDSLTAGFITIGDVCN